MESRFRFWGNFPTRLIDPLHPKKRCFLQNNINSYYYDRTPWLSRTSPISWVLFYHMASWFSHQASFLRFISVLELPMVSLKVVISMVNGSPTSDLFATQDAGRFG